MTRTLLLLLTAGLIAACQPRGTVPPAEVANPGITPEYVASLPAGQSRPVVEMLSSEVLAAVTEACNERPDIDWEACVSGRMLVAFDRYGFLASHCKDQPGLKAVRACVQFGRSGVDWLLALGGNPDTEFDWSKPEQSHDAALRNLNDALTERCKSRPEEPGNSCFTQLSAELLGLSGEVAARCAARDKLEERGACIIDAHDTAMYGAALDVLAR